MLDEVEQYETYEKQICHYLDFHSSEYISNKKEDDYQHYLFAKLSVLETEYVTDMKNLKLTLQRDELLTEVFLVITCMDSHSLVVYTLRCPCF